MNTAPTHSVPATQLGTDPWTELRRHTPARIALGRSGDSLTTVEALRFEAAHAQARDAVHVPLDVATLDAALQADGWDTLQVHSRAATREAYLRRPDWGRRLDTASAQLVQNEQAGAGANSIAQPHPDSPFDLALVLADGLSARAVHSHGVALLAHLRACLAAAPVGLRLSPVVLARQARVALADEVGELLGARLVLIVLGERPGLSASDSLGAYLTHAPRVGCHDAQRNCVSNIRTEGLPPAAAAQRLAWLVRESLRRGLSGVALKDDSARGLLDANGAPDSETPSLGASSGLSSPQANRF